MSQEKNLVLDSVIPVRTVLKNGSEIVGAISIMSLVCNFTDHIIIIDPTVSLILLISSIGFYFMSKAKS